MQNCASVSDLTFRFNFLLVQPHLNKAFPIFSTFTWNVLMLFLNSVKTECLSAQEAGFAPILSAVEHRRQDRWQNLLLWLSAQETRAKNTGGVKHRDKVKNTRCIAELMVCQWHLHTRTHTLTTGPKITPPWCVLLLYKQGFLQPVFFVQLQQRPVLIIRLLTQTVCQSVNKYVVGFD